MNGEPAPEIRFFSYSSRIGRLRYFAYGMGVLLLLLPVLVLAGILLAFKAYFPAGLLFACAYIFMITMSFVFAVRRLHDIDASGYWSLIMGAAMLSTFLNALRVVPQSLFWLPALLGLADFILVLILLFKSGTQGDNKFGPMPPPNSTWVVAGAWSFLIVPFFGGIFAAIAIPAYQDYVARSQTAEAIQLAGAAEIPVVQYYQANKAWPTDLSPLYGGSNHTGPVGKFVDSVTPSASADGSFGVVATMRQQGVNRLIAGKSVELWTSDRGNTWHCGPASSNPVDPKFLPISCRDVSPPPP